MSRASRSALRREELPLLMVVVAVVMKAFCLQRTQTCTLASCAASAGEPCSLPCYGWRSFPARVLTHPERCRNTSRDQMDRVRQFPAASSSRALAQPPCSLLSSATRFPRPPHHPLVLRMPPASSSTTCPVSSSVRQPPQPFVAPASAAFSVVPSRACRRGARRRSLRRRANGEQPLHWQHAHRQVPPVVPHRATTLVSAVASNETP